MSRETIETLNTNTLIGFTEKRGTAWHYKVNAQGGETNHYPGAIPVDDVMRRLFHWQAQTGILQTTIDVNGTDLVVEDGTRQVIVRPDTATVLGVFKEGYQIHQYPDWLITQVANLIDDSNVSVASAGLLELGGMAWVQIEMPDNIVSPAGDEFRPSLLACTSHNGKLATTYKRVITRVVCDNTLECGLSEKASRVKVKHSRYSDLKIASARETLDILFSAADDFNDEVKRLLEQEVSGKQFVNFLTEIAPVPEAEGRARTMAEARREKLTELYLSDERIAPWQGTAYGILQLMNTYSQHFAGLHKGTRREEKNMFAVASGKLFETDRDAMATLDKVLANV